MKNLSTAIKVKGLISIGLWIIGSILLLNEPNGKAIIFIIAMIIITGLYSQIHKEKNKNIQN